MIRKASNAEELLNALREHLKNNEDAAASKSAMSFGTLRELLSPIAEKETQDIDASILEILNKYVEANPQGDGLPAANLWTELRKRGNVDLPAVEIAITRMLSGNLIYTRYNGFTNYLPGKEPELSTEETVK